MGRREYTVMQYFLSHAISAGAGCRNCIRQEFAKTKPSWRVVIKRPKLRSTLLEPLFGKRLPHRPRPNTSSWIVRSS